ncbi:nuclear transport factor 2 family protein [candidate division KSB1 bacterium]
MKSNILSSVIVLVLIISIAGCKNSPKIDVESEKKEIKTAIEASIGWALDKDFNLLYSIMAQDDNFFIFHPDSASTITGFEPFKKMAETLFKNPKFKATDFKVKQLRMNISNSGDVSWFSAYLDDHAEWDGRPAGWDNVRWTGVLEKRGGKWVIVQMHFSFPKG